MTLLHTNATNECEISQTVMILKVLTTLIRNFLTFQCSSFNYLARKERSFFCSSFRALPLVYYYYNFSKLIFL